MKDSIVLKAFDTPSEKIYRSVKPNDLFWDSNGRITSSVFDLRPHESGVSFDRADGRNDEVCCSLMHKRLEGKIISLTVFQCTNIECISLYHTPSFTNRFHTEMRYLTSSSNKIKQIKHRLAISSQIEPY